MLHLHYQFHENHRTNRHSRIAARHASARHVRSAPTKTSTVQWDAHLPLAERPWNIGLIVGPSGCGKSTIARHLWPDALVRDFAWPRRCRDSRRLSRIDARQGRGRDPVVGRLRQSARLAASVSRAVDRAAVSRYAGRAIAEAAAPKKSPSSTVNLVFDEYTSVVDRTVAQVASHALPKTIRRKKLRFVAVTCHEDVEAWLKPDWVYRPAEQLFAWRFLQRRPAIDLDIVRCRASAWRAIRTASLSEQRPGPQCRLLPGHLERSARRLLGLAAVCRQRAQDAARTSHGDAARLSGRRHRQRCFGHHRVDVAKPWLPGHQHDDAPGHDPQPLPVAALADDAWAGPGVRAREETHPTAARHHPAHRRV